MGFKEVQQIKKKKYFKEEYFDNIRVEIKNKELKKEINWIDDESGRIIKEEEDIFNFILS